MRGLAGTRVLISGATWIASRLATAASAGGASRGRGLAEDRLQCLLTRGKVPQLAFALVARGRPDLRGTVQRRR